MIEFVSQAPLGRLGGLDLPKGGVEGAAISKTSFTPSRSVQSIETLSDVVKDTSFTDVSHLTFILLYV